MRVSNKKRRINKHDGLANHHILIKQLVIILFLIPILGISFHTSSSAQRIGEQAEMDRLEQQADDLAAQNDWEGAALAIGKAAMMADLLLKKAQESDATNIFQAASNLYRGQELGLRALALFEQAGGTPPASAGVCHYLAQGNQKLHHSKDLLENTTAFAQMKIKIRRKHLLDKTQEWEKLLQDLQEDFACPDLPIER